MCRYVYVLCIFFGTPAEETNNRVLNVYVCTRCMIVYSRLSSCKVWARLFALVRDFVSLFAGRHMCSWCTRIGIAFENIDLMSHVVSMRCFLLQILLVLLCHTTSWLRMISQVWYTRTRYLAQHY